ncbi:hypothetical protein BT93_L1004 [Corymbia citriodora subsp. variegata]|uniref:Glycosyltransferase n=1 Tax=Corymbia citriodora subsp. variegata TaxID=360336 RepID=A0A8T0CT75_CORYI|nr:hypothetical protein BT93_L1004 [Corymbia citriodora subsp. variegata]
MASGHQIPMVDMGKLLSQHGATVTIVTTPLNALRLDPMVTAHSADSGLEIRLLPIRFPCAEAGLPEGCENLEVLPSRNLSRNFFDAVRMLQQPLEKILRDFQPPPTCIISDKHLPWTVQIASKLRIPRILFDGMSCFSFVCSRNIMMSKVYEQQSDLETFVVPGLPDQIELTRAQLPSPFNHGSVNLVDLREEIVEAEKASYGWLINSFEDLEKAYVQECRKTKGDKVWCVGPVSLCNEGDSDKAHRGNKSSINEGQCLKWLGSWPPSSVIYTCLGSLCCLTAPQLIELGSGLEATGRPFIWVIGKSGITSSDDDFQKWAIELEGRVQHRGLLIWGWAPQMLILSHPSVGGFLTHCGWNSTLEGICAGVPMVAWPLFSEQFYNERFIVKVLGIGASVGACAAIRWGEEGKAGVLVKREDVRKSAEEVMSGGRVSEEMRKKAMRLAEMAKRAIEGGSSYLEIKAFVEDVKQISNKLRQEVKDLEE